jgi:hypothetical protein
MATKRDKAKGADDSAPDPDFQAVRDSVPLPSEWRLDCMSDDDAIPRLERFVSRVERWAAARPVSEVAERLALEIFQRRLWQRDWTTFCETLTDDRAKALYQRKKARQGKGFRHWPKVKERWLEWQRKPSMYDGTSGFAAAMEADFPGVIASTLANKITLWKREEKSRNDES